MQFINHDIDEKEFTFGSGREKGQRSRMDEFVKRAGMKLLEMNLFVLIKASISMEDQMLRK